MQLPMIFVARTSSAILVIAVLLLLSCPSVAQDAGTSPTHFRSWPARIWVDPDTGHRVIRLTDEPNSRTLYFNENAYTPDRKDMIYRSHAGIWALNLATRRSDLIVRGEPRDIVVGTESRRVFFMKQGDQRVYAVNIDTRQVLVVGELPAGAEITTVNADESLLAGTYIDGSGDNYRETEEAIRARLQATSTASTRNEREKERQRAGAGATEERWASHLPECIFTLDLQSGQVNTIFRGNDWLNHLIFSPVDPMLLMYSHEGPALKVDRVWTIRSDGSQNRLMHGRVLASESTTHEFWSADGKTIWYDFQEDKEKKFALAGVDVDSGKRTVLTLDKAEASRHYNIASDNSLFCGDGDDNGHGSVVNNKHTTLRRKWIELFRPAAGSVTMEHLVDLSKQRGFIYLTPALSFGAI